MNSYTTKKLKAFLYQVKKAIKVHGESYSFIKADFNEFNEPEEGTQVIEIKGLWHTSNSFIQQTVSEATKINSKQQPQLLCEYKEAKELNTEVTLKIEDSVYKVIEVIDVGNFGVIGDICLEEVK